MKKVVLPSLSDLTLLPVPMPEFTQDADIFSESVEKVLGYNKLTEPIRQQKLTQVLSGLEIVVLSFEEAEQYVLSLLLGWRQKRRARLSNWGWLTFLLLGLLGCIACIVIFRGQIRSTSIFLTVLLAAINIVVWYDWVFGKPSLLTRSTFAIDKYTYPIPFPALEKALKIKEAMSSVSIEVGFWNWTGFHFIAVSYSGLEYTIAIWNGKELRL